MLVRYPYLIDDFRQVCSFDYPNDMLITEEIVVGREELHKEKLFALAILLEFLGSLRRSTFKLPRVPGFLLINGLANTAQSIRFLVPLYPDSNS